MHQKNKGKHVSKLKYVRIGDLPKDFEDMQKTPTVIDAEQEDDQPNQAHQKTENSSLETLKQKNQAQTVTNMVKNSSNEEVNSEVLETKSTPVLTPTKQFSQLTDEAEHSTGGFSLPPFLQRVFVNDNQKKSTQEKSQNPENKDVKLLTFGQNIDFGQNNPNSFSSIFNKEHEEVFGIQRVFRKSLIFLVLNVLSFALLTFASINFFNVSWVIVGIAIISYVVISNIFYIIVADRSYVWISLLVQALVLLITHAFVGLSFDKITLIFTFLILVFLYLSYAELEKVQLSSRLFSIAHITTESTRILTTIVLLTLSLGVFNQAVSQGSKTFISESFLDKPLIMNNVIIGRYQNLSLNRLLMKGKFVTEGGLAKETVTGTNGETVKTNLTFRRFLIQNFRPGEVALTEDERQQIVSNCGKKTTGQACDAQVQEELDKKLEVWRVEAYNNLPFALETELTTSNFQEVTKQFYINEITRFNTTTKSTTSNDIVDTFTKLLILPRTYIIPALVALMLFVALAILKPILNWFSFLFTLLVWNILKWTGFSRIDIETVEAEIVSI